MKHHMRDKWPSALRKIIVCCTLTRINFSIVFHSSSGTWMSRLPKHPVLLSASSQSFCASTLRLLFQVKGLMSFSLDTQSISTCVGSRLTDKFQEVFAAS